MKLAWSTDIHLNFLDGDARENFYQHILKKNCDALLISGDIAEAPSTADLLQEMARQIKKPIYFVLGNHDYYRGNIHAVHQQMRKITKEEELLFWLPAAGAQALSKGVMLVGQDGWADGRLGDYVNSRVELNDSHMIVDLLQERIVGKYQLLEKMRQLADVDAMQLKSDLLQVVNQHPKKIIVLTHVPPFKEACMHKGKKSDDDWLPYFSSKATGDVLMQVAKDNASIDFLVLCGHTHSEGHCQPLANLMVKVGKAEYCQPAVQEVVVV